ncbi:MAG: cyclic nucleotide-binding domain-containing protein, partial [Gammaproteobacteria bacterium]
LQPRQFTGVAVSPSIVLRLARNSMDKLFILNQERNQDAGFNGGAYGGEVEVSELDESDDLDWMSRLLQSDIFSRMPTANIHQLFALLEPIEYKIGDVVVKQGDSGEDFYIIQDGRCQVTRKASGGGKDVKLAELHSGDSFGEEALLAETTRNATVTMLTEGVLMRLSKQNFIDLIKNPTLHAVTYAEGESKVETGQAKWLDVRYENEHKKSSIDGSINIPLNSLRKQMKQLDSKIYYIVYCDTGGRSSAAAFLLAGAGFDVSYLSGGLVNHPDAADPSEVTNVPKPAASKPVPASKPASAPKDGKQPPAKAGEGEDFDDPEIKASFLEAQIARTNMQLERTASKEEKDEALKEAKAEMQKKLEEERTELEAAKKAAEAEAARLRKKEEENLSRMEAQAKKKIEAEKKRLEQVYANNAEEMEKLEKMKSEAENKARQERERLEKHAQESKHNKGEAERLKKELETARQAMAEEAEKRREEQAAAEAARVAAKKEAEKLISEYKSQHESYKAEEEKRLEEDRNKLEEQQRQIQKSLQEIQAARADAEALKLEAAKELSALKEKQRQSAMAQDGGVSLKSEIKHAEARLNQAKVSIAKSQQQTIQIQEQKRMNAADLETKRMEGQAMRKNLEADLANFREELEEKEKEFASMTTQLEHMRRIKERAEEAKAKAQMANANLLSDVKRQLDKK